MDVLMPQLGETVTEGRITKWFKTIGDTVEVSTPGGGKSYEVVSVVFR